MGMGQAALELVTDVTPQLGGSLDTNGFEVLFDDAKGAVFGDGSDASINFDGSDLEFDAVAGANFEFNLPGAYGARTSRVVISGQPGAVSGQPLLEINSLASVGNAYVLTIIVNSVTKFSVDNDGDVACGSSIAAGALGFSGAVNPCQIYSTAASGMVFGSFAARPPGDHKAKFGLGALGQRTLTAALDQDDHVILRDVDGASTYAEAGSVLRLERDVTNVTTEDGNFLECGGLAGSTYVCRIDKAGVWRGPVALAPRVVAIASSAAPTPDADATDLYKITALAEAATFGAPTGTPLDGQKLVIRIKDNATSRALGWNAIYRAVGEAMPTATTISKWLIVGFTYDATDSKWDFVGAREEL